MRKILALALMALCAPLAVSSHAQGAAKKPAMAGKMMGHKTPKRDPKTGRFISFKKKMPMRDAHGHFMSSKKKMPMRDAKGRFMKSPKKP